MTATQAPSLVERFLRDPNGLLVLATAADVARVRARFPAVAAGRFTCPADLQFDGWTGNRLYVDCALELIPAQFLGDVVTRNSKHYFR